MLASNAARARSAAFRVAATVRGGVVKRRLIGSRVDLIEHLRRPSRRNLP